MRKGDPFLSERIFRAANVEVGMGTLEKIWVVLRKRWGFLFTFLTIRGVHIETVTSIDTSSCVMVVQGFVSRRGTPAMIWSDNGTNFIGPKEELQESVEKWNSVNIAAEFAKRYKVEVQSIQCTTLGWRLGEESAHFQRVLCNILGTCPLTTRCRKLHYGLWYRRACS